MRQITQDATLFTVRQDAQNTCKIPRNIKCHAAQCASLLKAPRHNTKKTTLLRHHLHGSSPSHVFLRPRELFPPIVVTSTHTGTHKRLYKCTSERMHKRTHNQKHTQAIIYRHGHERERTHRRFYERNYTQTHTNARMKAHVNANNQSHSNSHKLSHTITAKNTGTTSTH